MLLVKTLKFQNLIIYITAKHKLENTFALAVYFVVSVQKSLRQGDDFYRVRTSRIQLFTPRLLFYLRLLRRSQETLRHF